MASSKSGSRKTTKRTTRTTSRTPNRNSKAYIKKRAAEREEAKTPPENLRDIYTIVFFAINLILVLGTYGVCGKVGKIFSGFFFGLFGAAFYVLPVFFFVAFCFIMANGPKPKLIKKLIWIMVLFLAFGFICQLVVGTKGVGIKELYFDGYSDHRGGGVIFGGIIVLIAKLLSRVGAVIITVLLTLIAIIIVTNVRLADIGRLFMFLNLREAAYYHDEDDDYDDDEEREIEEIIRKSEEEAKARAEAKARERALAKKAKARSKMVDVKIPAAQELKDVKSDSGILSDIKVLEPTGDTLQVKTKDSLKEIKAVTEIAPEYKPKDFFELEVDPSTYNDPLGSDTRYEESSGSVTESYKGPKKRTVQEEHEEVEKVTEKDKNEATKEISNEISKRSDSKKKYKFPPVKLLRSGGRSSYDKTGDATVRETAITLKSTLESFGVNVTITNCSVGPAITRYELQPEQGVTVNKILSLENDIKMALAAADIRIEAPIPGKAAIGIEIPNKTNQVVYFRDLIDNDLFRRFKSNVAFAVGKDISGQLVISDIAKMPHLLIAGATGSGKSVCINTLIMSILYKSSPEDVRLIMVDPKMVELTSYNGIPHLLIPVVTDPKKAAGALNWAVDEMTKRYQLFANYNVRNIEGFNKKVNEQGPNEDPMFKHMYQLVVIVDELADLMMVAHKEVEDSIVRLSQLARAAGIHLVIATQRPSVDVITGLIKANVPSRIAFAVSSGVDSRTILDMVGAEKLLGKGDMLFYPTGYTKPVRVQGAFIDDDEVMAVVNYIKDNAEASYDEEVTQSIDSSNVGGGAGATGGSSSDDGDRYDEYFEDAARFVIEKDKASIGYLQRMLRIGFNRAARIMDQLEEFGVVGPEEGTKPRKILMNMTEFDERLDSMS